MTQKLQDDEHDVAGHQYVCCFERGIEYRNSPKVTDLNEEGHSIKFNQVVKPEAKEGDWIRVGTDHWLPLVKFWKGRMDGTHPSDDDEDDEEEDLSLIHI